MQNQFYKRWKFLQFPLGIILTEILERKGLRGIKSHKKQEDILWWLSSRNGGVRTFACTYTHSSLLSPHPLLFLSLLFPALVSSISSTFFPNPSIRHTFMNICLYVSIHPTFIYPSNQQIYLKIVIIVKHNPNFWLINLNWKFA